MVAKKETPALGAYCSITDDNSTRVACREMPPRQREEVLNVTLATLIASRGMSAAPETITKKHQMPDVILTFRGLRCALEGKNDDVPNARDVVASDASKRVEQGIAHLAVGVVYPKPLRSTAFAGLPEAMNKATYEFVVFTEVGPGEWRSGGVDDILDELRRAHELLVRDDVVARAVDHLKLGMAAVSDALLDHPAVCDRLIDVLGIGEAEEDNAANTD